MGLVKDNYQRQKSNNIFPKLIWHFLCANHDVTNMNEMRHFLNDIILLAITVASVVSCSDYLSHTEGKNSLVNGLFRFCSKRHVGGASIRLLHANDVTYAMANYAGV